MQPPERGWRFVLLTEQPCQCHLMHASSLTLIKLAQQLAVEYVQGHRPPKPGSPPRHDCDCTHNRACTAISPY